MAGASPWFRTMTRSRLGRSSSFLALLGFVLAGVSLWAFLGFQDWLVARRPPVVVEAFLVDTATTAQIDELGQAIQEQEYFCDFRYVDREEARSEAARIERIKPLLDAYGGNPFLNSLRVVLCADRVEDCREAEAWLKGHLSVASVHAPVAQVDRLLAGELRLSRIVRASAAAGAAIGVLLLMASARLRAFVIGPELDVYDVLGASSGRIWARALWATSAPLTFVCALVVSALEGGSMLARFSGAWVSWPGARIPDFPHVAGALLLGGAVAFGFLASCVTAIGRCFFRRE